MNFWNKCIALLSMPALAGLASCNVHEFPDCVDEQATGRVTLHLDFSLELPPYKEIIYEQGWTRQGESLAQDFDLRYQVRLYRAADAKFSGVPAKSLTFTRDDISTFDTEVALELEPGSYRCLAWVDYVPAGSEADHLYDTADFSAISLIPPHSGNNNLRDAFQGVTQFELMTDAETDVTLHMERPMAKFRIIANDYDTFKGHEDCQVIVRYPGFMPNVFNMATNRPSDAATGFSFQGEIRPVSDSEAELGFDYVFVNGAEAPVTIMVEVLDPEGNRIASTTAFDVPLKRSMVTTVRGKFLTTQSSGGVGVNPDFLGDLNIFIP